MKPSIASKNNFHYITDDFLALNLYVIYFVYASGKTSRYFQNLKFKSKFTLNYNKASIFERK